MVPKIMKLGSPNLVHRFAHFLDSVSNHGVCRDFFFFINLYSKQKNIYLKSRNKCHIRSFESVHSLHKSSDFLKTFQNVIHLNFKLIFVENSHKINTLESNCNSFWKNQGFVGQSLFSNHNKYPSIRSVTSLISNQ